MSGRQQPTSPRKDSKPENLKLNIMEKSGKVIVFIIVSLLLVFIATAMKEAGAGAVLSVAGIAIYAMYKALFKNNGQDEQENQNDINLRK